MGKKKVLVVDDEVDFVELIQMRLKSEGYEVITANNGRDALERIKADKPDAIILDIMMPELDGLSVLKEVRQKDKRIPIFIVTAFSNEEKIRIAGEFNASGFIIKTQDLGKELKAISAAIEIAEKFKGESG
ncbi:MAG: response regulator [Candidatus Omnitrophota bacterium]|jgi:CheY-like chemotaxis protein